MFVQLDVGFYSLLRPVILRVQVATDLLIQVGDSRGVCLIVPQRGTAEHQLLSRTKDERSARRELFKRGRIVSGWILMATCTCTNTCIYQYLYL